MGNCLSSEEKRAEAGNGCKRSEVLHPLDSHRVVNSSFISNVEDFNESIIQNRSGFSLSSFNNCKQSANPINTAQSGSCLKSANSNDSGIVRTPSHHLSSHPSHSSSHQPVVIALYTYSAKDDGDLSFRKGDRLTILDDSDPDWWLAKHKSSNQKGYIPRNYVVSEAIETEE